MRTITATIDDSDYYILILAGKLGSVDAFTGKSWTRREYEYARAKGVPVLAFIRDQAAVTQDKAERDPSRVAMLEDFVHLVESNHLVRGGLTKRTSCRVSPPLSITMSRMTSTTDGNALVGIGEINYLRPPKRWMRWPVYLRRTPISERSWRAIGMNDHVWRSGVMENRFRMNCFFSSRA